MELPQIQGSVAVKNHSLFCMGVALSLTGNIGILCPRVTLHKIHKPGEMKRLWLITQWQLGQMISSLTLTPHQSLVFLNSVITIMLVTFMCMFAMQVLRCCM